MNKKRTFVPGFLNKWDEWLLLNKPETWSARTHLVAWYAGMFIILFSLFIYIIPDDPRVRSNSGFWATITVIISLIALIVWIMYLLRFNVFKRFGEITAMGRLKTFLLYCISTGIIVLIPFIPHIIESIKANQAFPDSELVKDVDDINIMINQLEHGNMNHNWQMDTLTVRNKLPTKTIIETYGDGTVDTSITVDSDKEGLIDTAGLREHLAVADSIQRLNDSMYVVAMSPTYLFIGSDEHYYSNKVPGTMNSLDIYRKVIRDFRQPDRQATADRLALLIRKYDYPGYQYEYHNDTTILSKISRKYRVSGMETSIGHILDRKERWESSMLIVMLRLFIYPVLIISLMLFVFRHTTIRTFFLSILAGALISVFSGFLVASTNFEPSSIFIMMLCWTAVFFTGSLLTLSAKTRSVWMGICINLFVVMIPFIPLILLSTYYALQREHEQQTGIYRTEYYSFEHRVPLAEAIGIVLLFVLLLTYVHRLYRKWYALPEN